jgi:predicted DNA-binding protein (MmcQ/YjbR family)
MARSKRSTQVELRALRAFGLAYPGAHTKSPWPGHLDLAVKDKTFAYMSVEGQPFSISCKLPHSSLAALSLPFASPTGYGLGKSGWVTATPQAGESIPVELFQAWIDESYRAQAPKKLVASLDAGAASGPGSTGPARLPRSAGKTKKKPTKTTKKTSPRARRSAPR